jgi:hypothetical protein
LPSLVELFSKAQAATVKQLRIVPPTYAEWLTKSEVTRIQKDIAALLGVAPPPSPTPTAAPTSGPTGTPMPSPTLPQPTESPPPPSGSPGPSP